MMLVQNSPKPIELVVNNKLFKLYFLLYSSFLISFSLVRYFFFSKLQSIFIRFQNRIFDEFEPIDFLEFEIN